VQQFWKFHQLLRERNEALDLTRLHGFDSVVLKHYVDSALVATLVDLPSPLLDLGTGAGFPGIPLKIVRPDIRLLLAEPRHKRVAFLEEAIRLLGLRDVEVVPHRVGPGFERPVRGVITRAVLPISATLARLAAWLPAGARVLFMKGPAVDEELEVVRRGEWSAHFRLQRDAAYSIPETTHARRLVILERTEVAPPEPEESGHVEELAAGEPVEVEDDLEDPVSNAAKAVVATSVAPGDTAAGAPYLGSHPVRELTSASNPTFKMLRALLGGRGVRKHGQALVAGSRPIHEIVRAAPKRTRAWITAGATPAPPGDAPASLVWYRLPALLFREVDVFGTGGPLLLVDAPPLEPWTDTDWAPGCTLFVPFQDPENVGAVLRTAAAFGVAEVVLLREAANPFHPRSARAAGSALVGVAMRRGPSTQEFAPAGAPVFALSPEGKDVGGVSFPDRFGVLAGLEGPGLPPPWRGAETLSIPMAPRTDSLNAAAAVAIVLYLWSRSSRPVPPPAS
jgi:16S rRNA (guanine527-N7)-methyltransferase